MFLMHGVMCVKEIALITTFMYCIFSNMLRDENILLWQKCLCWVRLYVTRAEYSNIQFVFVT